MRFVIVLPILLFPINVFGNNSYNLIDEVPTTNFEAPKVEINFYLLHKKKQQNESNKQACSLNKYKAEVFIARDIWINIFGVSLCISYPQEENLN